MLLIVYAVGAAVPMLAIAYGGQFVTTRVRSIARVSHRLQQGFGAVIIVFAAANVLAIRHAHHGMAYCVLSKRPIRPVRGEVP